MKLTIKRSNKTLFFCFTLALSSILPSKSAQTDIPVFATQIDSNNAHALIRKGPDAIGGIGDWFFTNGTLCAIISDVEHEGQFSTKGGSLVDLGFCGRADDHFSATHDLLQGSRRRPIDTHSIDIEHSATSASVIVKGATDGAKITTRYTLHSDQPDQLHIRKQLFKTDGEKFNFARIIRNQQQGAKRK